MCQPSDPPRAQPHARRSTATTAATAFAALGVAGSLLLAGCGGSGGDGSASGPGGQLRVVATTTQAGDFSRVIGGDLVEVTQLVKPNVDPHDFEPSPADLDAIAEADVLVTNGVGLESWLDDAVEAAGFDGTRVVMADGVTLREGGHEHGDEDEEHADEHEHDPHVWHDPRNAKIMVAGIERAFAAADPENTGNYLANLTAYTVELDELDRYTEAQIATIPEDQRLLVTNHDSFGYYTARYGITYVGAVIPSFDTSAELSGQAIQEIVAKIRATGAKAVFSESSLSPKTADTIGREADVTVIAGEDSLYADSLGPPGSAGGTYLTAERHNTDVIVAALR
ncbi:metal ABC transporter substrate-binding protein [Frankia nepalensis]|uniref:metal ABC transporter substrate-binding protein n=1 Tax=Frankia nepalensis TaxID=1836974 RepID=UPI0038996947